MAGIYIHIPFCKRRCAYCDFYSCTRLGDKGRFLDALEAELEHERGFIGGAKISTIYFGGGTPSLLSPGQIKRILSRIGLIWDCSGVVETTVEVNPDDVSESYLCQLRQNGANRLSMGIQSFDDPLLGFMQRRHTARAAIGAVYAARRAGFDNISIDLIYGIPSMNASQWRDSISQAIDLAPEHISAYHLTIEEGTPFGKLARDGRLTAINEEESGEQYALLHAMLTEAGYLHYEISNFARPGFEAKHNSSYWSGVPYLGAGPSAHSYNGDIRRWSLPDLENYLSGPIYENETLGQTDHINEYVMTSLRCHTGIDLCRFEERFGSAVLGNLFNAAHRFIATGRITKDGNRLFIPYEHWLASDSIIASLFV